MLIHLLQRFPTNRRESPACQHARGMTLIEVLVSLIVISVGLLGVAALQTVSLRNSQGSYLRTQATALADDMIDRMRANRTVALSPTYGYNTAYGQTITLTGTSTRADHDRKEWKDALVAGLPATKDAGSADGRIQVDGTIATISIRWGERDPDHPIIEFVTSTEI